MGTAKPATNWRSSASASRSYGVNCAASPAGGAAAFTLIELVISGGVMAIILTAALVCFTSGISSQRLIESRADVVQSARVALALLGADLRAACPLSKDVTFLGMDRMLDDVEADNLDFATHHYTPRRAREGDFCAVSYFLAKSPASGKFSLWRRRNPWLTPDPLTGGNREEIARGLRGLRFEYYDGFDWYDEWGDAEGRGKAQNSWRVQPNLEGMPEAVRITLWFDGDPPAAQAKAREDKPEQASLVFQTVVRLNLAGIAQSTGSSDATAGGARSSGQPRQSTPQGGNP